MSKDNTGSWDLRDIAKKAMIARGLAPDFSDKVFLELEGITESATGETENLPDLTNLLWCSIDNDDSRDIDQITVAEKLSSEKIKVFVGVADVDEIVKVGTAIDTHAKKNTTSVYTGVQIFPMLPEKLSTDLTSLSQGEVRVAVIMEMTVDSAGEIVDSSVYRAKVCNQAKLAYDGVAAWLEGKGPLPNPAKNIPGMDEQLRIQDKYVQFMRRLRHQHGALELETIEPRAILRDGVVVELKVETKNRARELIEDFMIAANGITARYLTKAGYPALRRVVRTPKRWDRIVKIAHDAGDKLPSEPDAKALANFLSRQHKIDPVRFSDLSLTVIKLLGRGEYILEMPSEEPLGHFGLAVRDYAHSTAPNRRFPDLITQRLLKAAMKKEPLPYKIEELKWLAAHCTAQEDAADKVERQVRKSEAALLLVTKIGQYFDGIITGASSKGTWGRVFEPPVEGKIFHSSHDLDIGDRVRLKLIKVNIERGFIDFVVAE